MLAIMIKDCPVVEKDADLAHAMFGPDVSVLKGEPPRQTPRVVIQDTTAAPPELARKHSSIELCTDSMCISGTGFMMLIGCLLHCRKTTHTINGKKETSCECLDKTSRICNSEGCRVDKTNCDDKFRPIVEDVRDESKCNMNCMNAQDHEPHVERNNHVIKNQTRVGLHRSAHKTIPCVMLQQQLAVMSTDKSDNFPVKHGTLSQCITETSVTEKTSNFKKHCSCEFGECTQAHVQDEPRNGMCSRPNDNAQGGHVVMDLTAGAEITHGRVTLVSLTVSVEAMAEAMAVSQGICQ